MALVHLMRQYNFIKIIVEGKIEGTRGRAKTEDKLDRSDAMCIRPRNSSYRNTKSTDECTKAAL